MSERLEVAPDCWVEIAYTLSLASTGEIVEVVSEAHPVGYVHGYARLLPGLEALLEGALEGETLEQRLEPRDAYGERDDSGVYELDREMLVDLPELEPGSELSIESPEGDIVELVVTEVFPDHVVADSNHPLAGEALDVKVRVLTVRWANDDEVARADAELVAQTAAANRFEYQDPANVLERAFGAKPEPRPELVALTRKKP